MDRSSPRRNHELSKILKLALVTLLFGIAKLASARSFFFQAGIEARKNVSHQEQLGHVRGAEGRSARLLLTLNTSPCPPKKKELPSWRVFVRLVIVAFCVHVRVCWFVWWSSRVPLLAMCFDVSLCVGE